MASATHRLRITVLDNRSSELDIMKTILLHRFYGWMGESVVEVVWAVIKITKAHLGFIIIYWS
jgi:hypothetical protein